MLAVYQKELWTYFRSPIAYFVVAVFLVGTGYFFTYNIVLTGNATMTETFQNMGILLLLVMPVVSMRLFASEYSAGTMELLLTLPLTPWQIVLGKYLGAGTILMLLTAGTLIDLIPLYLFGNPETMTILAGYIGFVLLGMACLAVGQFFSALTHNQIVAALITGAVLLGFWFVGHLQRFQTSSDPARHVRLSVVLRPFRRVRAGSGAHRRGDLLPRCLCYRVDPHDQLFAVATLKCTALSSRDSCCWRGWSCWRQRSPCGRSCWRRSCGRRCWPERGPC